MNKGAASSRPYVVIGLWLAALMILGVVLCELKLGFPRWVIVVTVLCLSTIKASLVALYYMHLRSDRWLLALVALVPFALILLALGVVFSSTFIRL